MYVFSVSFKLLCDCPPLRVSLLLCAQYSTIPRYHYSGGVGLRPPPPPLFASLIWTVFAEHTFASMFANCVVQSSLVALKTVYHRNLIAGGRVL